MDKDIREMCLWKFTGRVDQDVLEDICKLADTVYRIGTGDYYREMRERRPVRSRDDASQARGTSNSVSTDKATGAAGRVETR